MMTVNEMYVKFLMIRWCQCCFDDDYDDEGDCNDDNCDVDVKMMMMWRLWFWCHDDDDDDDLW